MHKSIESKIVGHLHRNAYNGKLWISAPFPIPYLDNQKVKIVFIEPQDSTYVIYADKILENFLKLTATDKHKCSNLIYKNYAETLLNHDHITLHLKSKDDIWNYVHTKEIYISWDENAAFNLYLLCKCYWEKHFKLQLLFHHGKKLTHTSYHYGHRID